MSDAKGYPRGDGALSDAELESLRAFLAGKDLRGRSKAALAELRAFLASHTRLDPSEAERLARAILQKAGAQGYLDAEERLLARCLAADGADFLQKAALEDVDWAYVTRQAFQHQVAPLLYVTLRDAGQLARLPVASSEALRSAYERNRPHHTLLQQELARLIATFSQSNIEVVLLKGAALSELLYADPAARTMNDLDLLVRAGDVERAERILAGLGYRPAPFQPELRPLRFLRTYGGAMEYARDADGQMLCVDLHWRLASSEWLQHTTRLSETDPWADSQPCGGDLKPARRLSPFLNLTLTVLHLFKHGFGPGYLRWLADVDRLWRTYAQELDTTQAVERARQLRVAVSLHWVLRLCRQLMATPISDRFLRGLAPHPWRIAALRRLLSPGGRLYPPSPLTGRRRLLLEFLLLDRPWAALPAGAHLLFPERDWLIARYGLEQGGRAWWRYRFIHPFRVLRQGGA